MRLTPIFFLAVMVTLASAMTVVVYDPSLSSYTGLNGTFLQNSEGIYASYIKDMFKTGTAVNSTAWANDGATIGANYPLNITGTGNVTFKYDIHQVNHVNVSYLISVKALGSGVAGVRVVDGYGGAQTRYDDLCHYTASDGTYTGAQWITFNQTTDRVTCYNGTTSASVDVSAYSNIYVQFFTTAGGTLNLTNYINGTTNAPLTAAQFAFTPTFAYWNGSMCSGWINATGISTVADCTGTPTFSLHQGLYWKNYTLSLPNPTGYAMFFDKNYIDTLGTMNFQMMQENNPTLSLPQYWTVDVTNGTALYQQGLNTSVTFAQNANNLPFGVTAVILNKSDYNTRRFNFPFCGMPQTLSPCYYSQNLFLLPTSSSASVTFLVRNTIGTTLQGANVYITRLLNGQQQMVQMVESVTTDSSGSASVFLSPSGTYQVTVSANGYQSSTTANLIPTTNTYSIVLQSTSGSNFTSFFFNTSYTITPGVPELSNSSGGQLAAITFTTSATDAQLETSSLSVAYWNGTTLCSQSSASGSGAALTCVLNISALTNNVTATFAMSRIGNSQTFRIVQPYSIVGTRLGLANSAQIISEYFTPWSKLILALIISLGVTLLASVYLGFGSSIVLALCLAVFMFFGWVDFFMFVIVALIVGGLIVLGRFNL